MSAISQTPQPLNEPVKSYAPGTEERAELKARLVELRAAPIEIPLIIGGKEVRTGNLGTCLIPHDHGHVLAHYHKAGPAEVEAAIQAALDAWPDWSCCSWEDRVAISLKAAELISKQWRGRLNAVTMLGQSKTAHQAEIDAICELADFLRMNTYFSQQIYQIQPESFLATWNRLQYRPLEGFVLAVAPFNFTSIAGNLATAPAFMGNVVILKPASTAVASAYYVMRILQEAGLPDGVINFLPGDSSVIAPPLLTHRDFAGVHFTGSNVVFNSIWKTIGENISSYRSYPRIVGETGGKDFAIVHPSAEVKGAAACLLRGAFEYQGQKCSATSRAYVARSFWPSLLDELKQQLARVKVGPVEDFGNFMGAVIDRKSFDNIVSYLDHARQNPSCTIVHGGGCDGSRGYFVEPTIVVTTDPHCKLMEEEIFGPVLTVYLYDDGDYESVLELCDQTSPYALTGGVFAQDRRAVKLAEDRLRYAAGNFYINDKTTGAVVGHQPFGGARSSGTNDKAGSIYNLLRWMSLRTIKECFNTPRDFGYPFLVSE
ncbi:MAG: L-glutamate gamma-semialdehyde dehydrogenase [Thermoanaerobaculaceae bacterium]|nr:L-glutamate gamma-semialdehyde dehydrogenase [Thermoanaerobaculaceae bacterium]MDI9620721.1 L-glutamate gamma-semialdehyde dehydrogenase [Acidobacteriota bacterium]HPW55832.1 L-glutamate gamma-semialdehyde dehydrogenase [Thermoanaerobaculaceae bacterium]